MSKTLNAVASRKTQNEKVFSPTLLSNFFNSCYHGTDTSKSAYGQTLSFKAFGKQDKIEKSATKDNVIDLGAYEGLNEFIKAYQNHSSGTWADFISTGVFDLRLRASLHIADELKLKSSGKQSEGKINIFREFVVPQMKFERKNQVTIQTYIDAITNMFSDDDRLKSKIYNTVFPHDTHKHEDLPEGVNVIYLQHVSKYHDMILNKVIREGKVQKDVLVEIQKSFSMSYRPEPADKEKGKELDAEIKRRIPLQLLNPLIIELVMNPPIDKEKSNEGIPSTKWIKDLRVCVADPKTKKLIETTEILSKDERDAVKELVRELSIAKIFIDSILGSVNARRLVRTVTGKTVKNGKEIDIVEKTSEKIDVDLQASLDTYEYVYNTIREFVTKWKSTITEEIAKIQITKEAVRDGIEDKTKADAAVREEEQRLHYELFLKYFVAAGRLFRDVLGNAEPFKAFTTEIKKSFKLKFGKKLRESLKKAVLDKNAPSEDEYRKLSTEYYSEWAQLDAPSTYDPYDTEVYSRIGKYCGLTDLKKDYRVAVGAAIVMFIQDEIRVIRARNHSRKDLTIYIKC